MIAPLTPNSARQKRNPPDAGGRTGGLKADANLFSGLNYAPINAGTQYLVLAGASKKKNIQEGGYTLLTKLTKPLFYPQNPQNPMFSQVRYTGILQKTGVIGHSHDSVNQSINARKRFQNKGASPNMEHRPVTGSDSVRPHFPASENGFPSKTGLPMQTQKPAAQLAPNSLYSINPSYAAGAPEHQITDAAQLALSAIESQLSVLGDVLSNYQTDEGYAATDANTLFSIVWALRENVEAVSNLLSTDVDGGVK